ncbi:MAG: TIM barrel protein [Bacteroidota bacterium]
MTPALLTDTISPDVRRAVDAALLWGLEAVALRTIGRERVPNTNEHRLLRVLRDAEMPVAWVDPGLFQGAAGHRAGVWNDVEALRDVGTFCARLGCSVVAVGSLAEASRETAEVIGPLRRLGDAAAREGLRVGVRNEGMAPSAMALAALVRETDHPAVGALWSLRASREAEDDLAEAASVLTEAGLLGVEADERIADDADMLETLARGGFGGPVVLALESPQTDGLAVSTALVRGLRQARRAARG